MNSKLYYCRIFTVLFSCMKRSSVGCQDSDKSDMLHNGTQDLAATQHK